jgi:hypothetical protein
LLNLVLISSVELIEWIIFLFIHLMTNTLIGDLRDIRVDGYHQTETLPSYFGFSLVKKFLVITNSVALIYWLVLNQKIEYVVTLIVVLIFLFTLRENTRIKNYHYVDIVHFIPLGCLLLLS